MEEVAKIVVGFLVSMLWSLACLKYLPDHWDMLPKISVLVLGFIILAVLDGLLGGGLFIYLRWT